MVKVRPANNRDVELMVPDTFGKSMRGVVVEVDGRVIGISGILHTVPPQCFATITDELKAMPKALLSAVRLLRTMLNQYSVPVYSLAEDNSEVAIRFLEHVGFVKVEDEDLYVWPLQSRQ
jgi:hypothetical protein